MGNGNFGVSNSTTPEPIDSKFGVHDYVGDLTSYAKFHKFRRPRASLQYIENVRGR